jgi:hypothetical protein
VQLITKPQNMKKLILILIVFFCTFTYAQDKQDINPLRLGLKIGTPNIIGGNVEFVTPLLNNRFALFVDYSGFTFKEDASKIALKYFEAGTNIYFKKTGKGLYASLAYGTLNLDGNYKDAETRDGTLYEGEANGSIDVSTLNSKLGVKLGNKIYFRIEAGYGFGDIPKEIEVTGTEKTTGTTKTDYVDIPDDIPGIDESGYLVFNIGFGISF